MAHQPEAGRPETSWKHSRLTSLAEPFQHRPLGSNGAADANPTGPHHIKQTTIHNYLRCRRKSPLSLRYVLHPSTRCLLTLLMILLCDSPKQVLAQSSGELSQQQGALSNLQRFLEEPQDTQVLLGQSVDLACTVESKRGELVWFRDEQGLNLDDKMFKAWENRFSLPSLDTKLPPSFPVSANYTLHIQNVSIKDDALFYCAVSQADAQHRNISSRKAKVSVIQAPTKLELEAFELTGGGGDDADSQPVKLFSSSQPDYLLTQEQPTNDLTSLTLPTGSSASLETLRLVVRRGVRLKLECQTDLARPHAELIWLDNQQRKLSGPQQAGNGEDLEASLAAANSSSYVKQFVSTDTREPRLATTTATYTFTVESHHSDQLFTCQVKHPGLQTGSSDQASELRRQVRLEVQFEPEVEIEKEPAHRVASELQPVRFHCRAQAWPSQLTYSWFIDDEPVQVNGSQSQLHIERPTRQLHLRNIKCVARNSVGEGSANHRFVLNYGLSFVSHLLLSNAPGSETVGAPQHQPKPLGQASESGLAKQLAESFDEGQNVVLHCDFDANPRPQQVSWFRMSTDYLERKEVGPAEADELMNFGYGHRAIYQLLDSPMTRHWDDARLAPLDYEQMSQELVQEMAECWAKMKQPNSTCQIDELSSHSNSHSAFIQEPLRWTVQDSNSYSAAPTTSATSEDEESAVIRLNILQSSTPEYSANVSQTASSNSPLQRRESILSSSTITLTRANLDSVGRYICQARSTVPAVGNEATNSQVSGQTTTIARALHLVLRRGPRLISASVQYSNSLTQLQVECLAQVHMQLNNTFIWSKNGQIIDMMNREPAASGARPRIISIVTQYSPDLLLARSILHIDGGDARDFGKYNCTVVNSIDSNQMMIDLRAPEPTGFVFNLMFSLTLGSILLLVATMSLLIVCVPRRRLHSKCAMDADLATKSSHASQDSPPEPTKQQPTINDQLCDKNAIFGLPAKGDANSPSVDSQSIYANDRLRSSSRQRNFVNRSSNFSAIHESLENKLQRGSNDQQQNYMSVESDSGQETVNQDTCRQKVDPLNRVASVSEIEKSSFLVRLVACLLMKSKQQQKVKSRPVISLPIEEPASYQRSSASTLMRTKNNISSSLDMLTINASSNALELGNSSCPESNSKPERSSHNLSNINGSMVSSKANLIQDSTTASDGTGSSRSSSCQGEGRSGRIEVTTGYTNAVYPQHHQQQVPSWIPPELPPKLSINIPSSSSSSISRQQPINHLPPMDCTVYVNHEMSLPTTHHQHKISNIQQQQPDLYATCTSAQCSEQMSNNGATAGYVSQDQILWSQTPTDGIAQFMQPVIDHYQYPIVNNIDAHYNPVQSIPATCYSTVQCPISNSATAAYSIHSTIPQVSLPPSRHQMVPTSDGGDAYFESNYGTLISRSSAYKTLGYVTSSQTTNTNSMSTCSSSPNSLMGVPPNSNTQSIANHTSHDIHLHKNSDLRFSKRANGYVDLDDPSSGMIVVKNQNMEAGLATHV